MSLILLIERAVFEVTAVVIWPHMFVPHDFVNHFLVGVFILIFGNNFNKSNFYCGRN